MRSWCMNYLVDEHISTLIRQNTESYPEAAKLLWGDADPHRYYSFIGTCAFVFSADGECKRLFGVDSRSDRFVDKHVDWASRLLLGGP
ncbi:MAG: hypothetical protein ACI87W_001152 [Halieaceae bacterium]